MRTSFTVALVLALAGCATPRPRPDAVAPVARVELPPHVVEAVPGWGWYSCAPGYILRRGACLAESELPAGPEIIVSSLPSAGDGAPGTCPSGGCGSYGSYVAPSYSTFVYSAGSSYDYWPTGFYYNGGVFCPSRARRFRVSEFAFGGRFGSFVQERRFEGWKSSFPGATFRVRSFAGQRSPASSRFGSNRTGRRR
jgi:hypothetical protein